MQTAIIFPFLLVFTLFACNSPAPQDDPTTEEVPDTLPAPEQTTGYDNEEGYSTDQMSTDVAKKKPHAGETQTNPGPALRQRPLSQDALPDRYGYRLSPETDSLWYDPQVPFEMRIPTAARPPLFTKSCLQDPDPMGCSYAEIRRYFSRKGLSLTADQRVYATFILDKTGKVDQVVAVTSKGEACRQCEEEVIRLLENMPAWSPGLKEGVPVRSSVRLPVPLEGRSG